MDSRLQLKTPRPADEPVWLGIRQMFWDEVRQVIEAVPEVEAAVVFGSRAYGNYRPASDVDICLFGQQLSQTQRWRLEEAIDDLLWPWEVDLVHWEGTGSPRFRDEVRRDAVVLFNRSHPGARPGDLENSLNLPECD